MLKECLKELEVTKHCKYKIQSAIPIYLLNYLK